MNCRSKSLDTRVLRGGNNMKMPAQVTVSAGINTDPSKKVTAGITNSYEIRGNHSGTIYELYPYLSVRPVNILKIALSGSYAGNVNDLQYITSTKYSSGERYILGRIDQKTLGFTIRADLNLTPRFSVQYYGSPFVSKGSYSAFKRVTHPEAENYSGRFSEFSEVRYSSELYELDEDNDHITDYSIGNPDFDFCQFRSNLVLRWEYRLGSFFYFVWSSDQTGNYGYTGTSFSDSYRKMFSIYPKNIFLIKLSYWFSV